MAGSIGQALLGSDRVPSSLTDGVRADTEVDAGSGGLDILYKAALFLMEDITLDRVTDLVVEETDTGRELCGIALCGHEGLGTCAGGGIVNGVACPAFAVHHDTGIDLVHVGTNHVHGLAVMHAHQVKTITVDVVLFRPVLEHFTHILAVHRALGGGVVTAAGLLAVAAVSRHTIIVFGNSSGEAGVYGISVVVNNVHDDADTGFMERFDHLLALVDTDIAVIGVRGIRTLGNAVVLGIVAPVELSGITGFVDGSEVIHRVDLNMGHAQAL